MSKENPKITQELKWKDAWIEEENEFDIKYRKRTRKELPDPWVWDPVREDWKNRNWKRFRKTQWKVKKE